MDPPSGSPMHSSSQQHSPSSLPGRNHIADADSSHSRKRPRLSDELASPPTAPDSDSSNSSASSDSRSLSAAESPLILELPQEQSTDPSEIFIIMTGNEEPTKDPLGNFPCLSTELPTPVSAASRLAEHCREKDGPDYAHISNLTVWLRNHLQETEHLFTAALQQESSSSEIFELYSDNVAFWNSIVVCYHSLLKRDRLRNAPEIRGTQAFALFETILNAVLALGERLLHTDMAVLLQRDARRDSTSSPTPSESPKYLLYFTSWLDTFTCLTNHSKSSLALMSSTYSFNIVSIQKTCILRFQGRAMDAIVQLVGHIVSKPENISSPFGTVNRFLVACLTVLRSEPPTTKGLLSLYHEKSIHLFKSIQHMTTSVLPKHHLDDQSQLVMEHFRTFLVETLDALGRTRKLSPTAIFDLTMKDVAEFQVKRADLLLPPNDEAASTIDQDKGRDDFDGLLSTEDLYFAGLKACTLQFQNALIHSSSVDLRNRGTEMIGIEALNTYLNKYGLSTGSSKLMHRYLAKFLHANDITAYLYGPQSHATLIDRTYNIVGFLALTHNLRKSDADLIWSVFVNSQQPDNAQNAGKVLLELVKIIPDYVLRYFCSKFRDMPLSQFSKAAEMVLDTLASKLRGVANSKDSDVSYMCICLLDKLTDVGVTANMQDHLLAFLGSIIMQSSSLEGTGQQIELVEICAKHIVSHSTKATGYVQALMSLTRQKTFSVQPQELLLRLSFSQCGEELIHFLDRTRSGECTLTRHALMCRVELVFHLLSISGPEVDTIPMEMNLWDHLVGQHTLSPEIRDMGWYFLDLHLRSGHPGLEPFYRRCISQYLPNLSVDLVTLGTRKMFFLQARRERENPDILVPLESDLIRFALFCPALNVAHHFMAMLAEFLFNEKAIKSPDLAAAHQVAVVKQCVARLSSNDISSDRAVVVVKTILIASYEFEKTIGLAEKSIPDAHHDNTGAVGDSIQIPIHVHKGGAQSQSTVITVNKTASCSELSAAIAEETGFQSYTTITAGRQIDFAEKPDQSITQLGLKEGNLLIVQKRNTLQSIQDDTNKHVGRTAVEKELLSHLDILYSILDEPTFRATEALIILSHMRYPGPIRAMMADPETTFDEKFPFTTSPRLRTSLEVLHMQFREQVALGVADEKFLLRGVHLLIQLLHRDDLLRDVFDTLRTADILFDFLRERPPVNDAPEEYFEDPSKFIFRILDLLKRSQHDIGPQSSKPVLIRALYQCLMESVMLSPTVRAIFLAAEKDAKVHLSLLLHSNDYIRGTTSATIGSMIQQERTSSDVRSFFSSIFLNHLIPAAMGQPTTCESLFAVAIDNFSSDPNINGDPVKLRFLIEEFSKTLLSLQHCENYGDSLVDKRVQGFISLLCCCIRRLKYLNTPLNLDELASRVFTRLLFPPPETSSLVKPIVSLETRRIVYELLRLMCEDVQTVETLAANCQSVLKYSAIPEDFMFPGPERFVRSEGNYAGLDNLSQTCYMNSLIQQLFMNIQFRKFVFDTRVVDEEKQAVLREFKIAFARMQDSHGVSYRPEALAKALNVDHLVQDDAHIFFMTMIGKLEDSMPDNEAKNTMKGFFRGVNKSQTIGSCKHVSESTDEYFNLSLVVKDKSTLEESLEEYIKGAVLEGSDRFRCTTCGSGDGVSVDAVRRTALDHIPDNLVLGLRRFRYETYDGGSKVNDRFDFPERIDMSKYKLNRLAGVEGSGESDVFQLVGVVVHQGTLAYGHYWSYAAERGPTASNLLPWYRLEDSFVTRSSIADVLRETCGGPESTTNPLNRDLRSDNAYVLFYQRTSSVEDAANCLATSITKSPTAIHAKIRLPEDLEDEISKENEQMLHILNLFSTEHIEFVRGLAGRLEEVKKSDSARNVKVASNIMFTLFAYYSRVVTRSFSPESIDYTSQVLQKFACSDKRFALWTLQQIFPQGDDFDGGLLLHKKQMVRYATSRLVMACLTYLRVTDPVFYGLEEDEYAEVTDSFNLESVISGLYDLLDFLHDCRPSTWREYFDLVGAIAELGTRETFMLLEFGFLGWCLEVLLLRDTPYLHEKHEKMLLYLNDWGRRVEFAAIFKCVYSLLHKYVDFHGGPAASLSSRVDSRSTLASGWQLTEDEHALLTHPHGSTECNWFMHYLLQRLARPQENNYAWAEWPPTKFAVLLTDAEKVPQRLYKDTTCALIASLKDASSWDLTAETTALCLIGRKMKTKTEEDIFSQMKTVLRSRSSRDRNQMASSMQWITSQVYQFQPQMIIHHLAGIVGLLLICDDPQAEADARDWWRNNLLVANRLRDPLVLRDVETILHRMKVVQELYIFLDSELGLAVNKEDFNLYRNSTDAYLMCSEYLTLACVSLETEIENSHNTETDADVEALLEELLLELRRISQRLLRSEERHASIQAWKMQDDNEDYEDTEDDQTAAFDPNEADLFNGPLISEDESMSDMEDAVDD